MFPAHYLIGEKSPSLTDRVLVLVSVRFEISCVSLHFGAQSSTAKPRLADEIKSQSLVLARAGLYLQETSIAQSPKLRQIAITFTNPDGTDREDDGALRAEIRRLNLESAVILEMRKKGRLN